MYLHCCHLLPLCSWCYCCGSLLLMFISYKCHTQSTDIAGPQYQLSVVAQSTDNRPVNDPPTTFVLLFCVTYSNMAGIFCTIGYFIKFCSTTKIAQRIWQLFFAVFFIGDVFTSCNLRADCLAGGLLGWLAIWRQVLLPLWGTRCLQHKL